MQRILRYSLLPLLFLGAACSTQMAPPEEFASAPEPSAYAKIPGWVQENHAEALNAFLNACPSLSGHSQPRADGSGLQYTPALWKSLCADATHARGNEEQARLFFEHRFVPYRITNGNQTDGLFTGYYEPQLYGSRKKQGDFLYPLYVPPPELRAHKPYFTRAEIDHGALDGRHLELLWVNDPVMLFFLHVQGSGRIVLTDGTQIRVGFADKNGQPYVGLGKIAADEGLLPKDKINFFSLREWLYAHPGRSKSIMEKNPSYIFFREIKGPGPTGTLNIVLTANRSLAVDTKYIPLGTPLFLTTQIPTAPDQPAATIHRLMLAQDTGTAIHGPIRGDIFFGAGKNAEYRAGMMKNLGSTIILVPREVSYEIR